MNSNQINYNNITFMLTGIAWADPRTGNKTREKQSDDDREIFILKDSKGGTWEAETIKHWMRFNETPKEQIYRIIKEPSWYKREVGGYKRGVDRSVFRKKLIYDIIPKAVDLLRLKQQLNTNTLKTFGELIDEL